MTTYAPLFLTTPQCTYSWNPYIRNCRDTNIETDNRTEDNTDIFGTRARRGQARLMAAQLDNTDVTTYIHTDRSTDRQTLNTQQVLRTTSKCCKYLGSHHQRRRFSEAHLFLHEVAAYIYTLFAAIIIRMIAPGRWRVCVKTCLAVCLASHKVGKNKSSRMGQLPQFPLSGGPTVTRWQHYFGLYDLVDPQNTASCIRNRMPPPGSPRGRATASRG